MRLIPNPASLDLIGSGFSLSPNTVIACPPALRAEAEMLAGWLRPATGFSLPVVSTARENGASVFRLRPRATLPPGGCPLQADAA